MASVSAIEPSPALVRQRALEHARERIGFSQPGRHYARAKRLVDLAVACALAPVALPVGLVVALLIKLQDGGPALFVQERIGRGGRPFRMVKFRTMCVDAAAREDELRSLGIEPGSVAKSEKDPRITPLGRVLRKTYVDELPQLVNVFRGEMSIVGPRPFSFSADAYRPWHTARFDAPPGITGLWQIRRRYDESSLDERLRLDMQYLTSRSGRTDLQIVWGTVRRFVRGDGR